MPFLSRRHGPAESTRDLEGRYVSAAPKPPSRAALTLERGDRYRPPRPSRAALQCTATRPARGAHRTRVEVSWVAFIRAVEEIEEEISSKVAEGFTAFKLKVGDEPHLDRERVRICRRIAGPEAYIKVDASGQWEEEEAVEQISALAAVGANAVETPLRAAARALAKDAPETVNERAESVAEALARVRRRVPIELIEHVSDFEERFATALIARRAVDVFNVVPVQAGRLQRAQRLLNLAESGGLRALIGSTVELQVSARQRRPI